jgi:hypothetical protein
VLGAAPKEEGEAADAGVAAGCAVVLPNGEGEAPNWEGAAALALGAAEDANANGDGDGEAADTACEAGIPNEGVAPNGEGEEEPPPKRPLLPNVDEPKPPPEEAAPVAPPKPNAGAEDAPPNKLPPAGALPAALDPNAGAEADVPNENDVGAPDDEALNPVNPDIVDQILRSSLPASILLQTPTLKPLTAPLNTWETQSLPLNPNPSRNASATPIAPRRIASSQSTTT